MHKKLAACCIEYAVPTYPGVATIMTIQVSPALLRQSFARAAYIAIPLAIIAMGTAVAQTPPVPPMPPTIPSDAPPRLERLEEGPPAGTPQPGKRGKGVTEKRIGSGKTGVTEVSTGVSTYYVRPDQEVGNAQPGDLQSSGNRAAQFRIKQFDLGQKNAVEPGERPEAVSDEATPPTLPTRPTKK